MSDVASVLVAVGGRLRAAKDQLNEADSAAGDGDLGITADTIGRTLIELAPELAGLAPSAAMRRLGLEIGSRAPSTFGTLLSMGLVGASRAQAGLDAPDAVPTDAEVAARLTRAVETAIGARGKAGRGGKTLLDALGPAADALEAASAAGVSITEAFALASLAAYEGAEETRTMEPTMGRQAWLADRARGAIDPGALAVAIAFEAAARGLA
jgi:dihydroxyacetone kinase-like protein